MKLTKYFLLGLVAAGFQANAQQAVELQMHHYLGDNPFALEAEASNDHGNMFRYHRMEYYVSEITVLHDGGQETTIADTWLLLNPGNEAVSTVSLGELDLTTIEGVRFSIGVDPEHNHEDPSQYEMSHPLAPKSPSMHWGWASGYRFVAMEGKSGENFSSTFEFHALGDDNYFETTVTTEAVIEDEKLIIPVLADYAKALNSIDVSGGVVIHGDYGNAVVALENFRDQVFSDMNGVGLDDNAIADQLLLFPSPSTDGKIQLKNVSDTSLSFINVYDYSGRLVLQESVVSNQMELTIAQKGLFTVVFYDGEAKRVATKKVAVL